MFNRKKIKRLEKRIEQLEEGRSSAIKSTAKVIEILEMQNQRLEVLEMPKPPGQNSRA